MTTNGSASCDIADFNGDGVADLAVATPAGGYLAINDGHLAFHFMSLPSLGTATNQSTGAAALYRPGQPLPDLYVTQNSQRGAMLFREDGCTCATTGIIRCGIESENYPGAPTVLLHNQGGGALTSATRTGLENAGQNNALGVYDVDGDGLQDVFLAIDGGRNKLYRNQGDGTYTDVSDAWGVSLYNHGMSVTMGDLNGDGIQDVAFSEVGIPLVQLGTGTSFGTPLGVSNGFGPAALWSWGAEMEDFDNDGDLDMIFFGDPFTQPELESFCPENPLDEEMADAELVLFRNDGRAHFQAEQPAPNNGQAFDEFVGWFPGGHTLGTADLDGDGVLDLFALRGTDNVDEPPTQPWVLHGVLAHPANGITVAAPQGSVVTACVGARCQTREVGGAHGSVALHVREVHFGIGNATSADVHVVLPFHQGEVRQSVRANTRMVSASAGG
jgi:hypothetical protein